MLKKVIFSLLLSQSFICSSYGFLNNCSFDSYVGIVAGPGILSGDYEADDVLTTGSEDIGNRLGGTSGLVGGVLGIQTYFCDYYFAALQGNALYNCLDKEERFDTFTFGTPPVTGGGSIHIKNHFQGGLDGRLGLSICQTTPYFLFGFEAGRFEMDLVNLSAAPFRGIPANSTIEVKKWLCGPKVGGGVVFPLTECLMFNFEYSYARFNELRKVLVDATTGTWTHNSNIRQHSVLWGLNYLF